MISLTPAVVILLSVPILREKPTGFQCACTALSIIGVGIISRLSDNGNRNYPIGILLLFGAVISSAFFNVLSRRISAEFSPFERTYVMFSVGSAGFFLLAAAVLRGRFLSELTAAAANGTFWGSVGYLAIVSSVLAFLLDNDATGRISSVRVASFSNLTTVVSVLAGTLILGETFRWDQWLLCAGIILGVWGVNVPISTRKSANFAQKRKK